jgi:hypothetical protein
MAGKGFWKDRWLKDQYNQRNPGQANHPDSRREFPAIRPQPANLPVRPQTAPSSGDKKK